MRKMKAQGSKTTLPRPQALPLPLASTMSSVRHSEKTTPRFTNTKLLLQREVDLYADKCLATSWGGGGGRGEGKWGGSSDL